MSACDTDIPNDKIFAKLYIKNLDYYVHNYQLVKLFHKFGPMKKNINIMRHKERNSASAFIYYYNFKHADKAISEMNGFHMFTRRQDHPSDVVSRKIIVEYALRGTLAGGKYGSVVDRLRKENSITRWPFTTGKLPFYPPEINLDDDEENNANMAFIETNLVNIGGVVDKTSDPTNPISIHLTKQVDASMFYLPTFSTLLVRECCSLKANEKVPYFQEINLDDGEEDIANKALSETNLVNIDGVVDTTSDTKNSISIHVAKQVNAYSDFNLPAPSSLPEQECYSLNANDPNDNPTADPGLGNLDPSDTCVSDLDFRDDCTLKLDFNENNSLKLDFDLDSWNNRAPELGVSRDRSSKLHTDTSGDYFAEVNPNKDRDPEFGLSNKPVNDFSLNELNLNNSRYNYSSDSGLDKLSAEYNPMPDLTLDVLDFSNNSNSDSSLTKLNPTNNNYTLEFTSNNTASDSGLNKLDPNNNLTSQLDANTCKSSPEFYSSQISTVELDINQSVTPQFGTTQISTPELNSSQISLSELDTPKLDTSELDTPELDTPELDTPELDTPELDTPELDTPELNSPKLDTSELNLNQISLPELNFSEISLPELDEGQISAPDLDFSQIYF